VDIEERAAMLEAVFRDSPDGILVVDAVSGAIIECNRAVRRFLGCDPERLIGKQLDALYGPNRGGHDSLPERVRLHGAVLEEGEIVRIDGSYSPMHLRAARARWSKRDVIVVTLRDVRDRHNAQLARRSAEARYENIFEHAVEGIFQTTPDGRYLSANPALAHIYGYGSPAELILHLTDIAGQLYVDPARRSEFRRLLEQDDVVRDFESEVHRKDGTTTWISENGRAVRDASGRLRYYEGTVIDVSARKHAEEARRSEAEVAHALAHVGRELIASLGSTAILERLAELVTQVLSCDRTQIWLWDTEADAYLPLSTGSAAGMAEARAVPRAELAALLQRFTHDEVAVIDADTAAFLPPTLRELQHGFGEALYFAIRRGGVTVGVLAGLYRRRSESFTAAQERIARGVAHLTSLALEHARVVDELERANRLKSEFVATISHEFRTPINIMIGYHEMLLDDGGAGLSEAQLDILARLGRTTRGLADLINATLDLSRLDAGRLPLDLGAVDVADLVAKLDLESRDLVRERADVTLRWEVRPGLPTLRTDPAKLQIVLKNLVGNAIKFTERGRVTVTAAPRLGGVDFTVEDTGIGIAPEALSYVFEAFRQGDGSTTRRHDGVGLGLHLVQRLVEVLGGTVSVKSSPGVGSSFRVWLPSRV
jgi:PAS domain S-box-containing protein